MIRPASPADAPAIAAMEHDVFGAEAWSGPQVREELVGTGRRGWVVDVDGRLAGYATTRTVADATDLQRIAVDPAHRRTGIARRLLDEAIAAARSDGADRMLLEVSVANAAATRFYADAGFATIDRRPRYYRDGSDAVVMHRRLGADVAGAR